MYKEYQEKLIEKLQQTKFTTSDNILLDFESGMEYLLGLFSKVKQNGKQVIFVGNGGSAAIASHMTADFMKNGGMKTLNLYDCAVSTCMSNDFGYEFIFSKPLEFLIQEKDLLVAISSSGNSKNIINAVNIARQKIAEIVTFSGFKANNTIRGMGELNVYVPIEEYGIVESIHNLILQQIVDVILERDACI